MPINKLEKWPKIGPKDASALREFSDMLDKVLAAKNTIPGLSVLDYAKENVKLLSTLPYYLETKWRDAIKVFGTNSLESNSVIPKGSKLFFFSDKKGRRTPDPRLLSRRLPGFSLREGWRPAHDS